MLFPPENPMLKQMSWS